MNMPTKVGGVAGLRATAAVGTAMLDGSAGLAAGVISDWTR